MAEQKKDFESVMAEGEKNRSSILIFLIVVGLFIFSLFQMNIDPSRIARGFSRMVGYVQAMFPPSYGEIPRLVPLAIESLQIAILGTFIGIILSIVLSMFAAKNLTPFAPLGIALKGAFAFTRAVPALVWALLFITAVGLGALPGILALGINSVGMLGKVFSESFEEMDLSVLDGLRSTGASDLQVFVQGVVPQTLPILLSWSLFRLDINIRYASILGVVGAGGIGWELVRASRMRDHPGLLMLTLIILKWV